MRERTAVSDVSKEVVPDKGSQNKCIQRDMVTGRMMATHHQRNGKQRWLS